jgi:tetratricopeptide (TPR) repeat protein
VYRQEAQLEQAREHARIAVQMALDQENALLQIVLLEVLAEVELDAGNLITAQNQVNQALELSRSMGLNSSVHHAMLLYLLGRIQAATGERQEACANFEQSVTILTDKDPIEAAIVQTTYGKLLLEIGQDEC